MMDEMDHRNQECVKRRNDINERERLQLAREQQIEENSRRLTLSTLLNDVIRDVEVKETEKYLDACIDAERQKSSTLRHTIQKMEKELVLSLQYR